MAPSVIVVGAGGNFGPSVMAALITRKSDFNQIAVLTSPEKKGNFAHLVDQGVEVNTTSLIEPESYKGFDVVISLTGNSIMSLQPKIIDAAIEAGVTHFYPSEFGGDIGREPFLTERYFQDKHTTRAHLRAKAKENPSFRYTLIMCGAFIESYALTTLFGVDREAKTFTFYADPENVFSYSYMPDVARSTVDSIFIPMKPGQNERSLRVPNGNWTARETIEALGETQGVKYTYIFSSVQEARKLQEHYRQTGEWEKEMMANLRVLAGTSNSAIPEPWDNHLFDWKKLNLREMLTALFPPA